MITIRCYSRDEDLITRLCDLYGAENVSAHSRLISFAQADEGCDIAVVDLKSCELPDEDQITIPLLVLSEVPDFQEGFALIQRGIRGYGNLRMRTTNLKQAIDNVAAGQIWLPPDFVNRLIDVVGNPKKSEVGKKESLLGSLSKREQEVALLVAKGMSNQEVADTMFVSLRTVKAHLSSIYEKTGVRNRLELGLALS